MSKYEIIVCNNGDREWYLNGKRHREDGPAIEYANGDREWYLNGKHHREDGPAVEWGDGYRLWFLNGEELTEDEFNKRTQEAVEMAPGEVCEALGKNIKIIKKF